MIDLEDLHLQLDRYIHGFTLIGRTGERNIRIEHTGEEEMSGNSQRTSRQKYMSQAQAQMLEIASGEDHDFERQINGKPGHESK